MISGLLGAHESAVDSREEAPLPALTHGGAVWTWD